MHQFLFWDPEGSFKKSEIGPSDSHPSGGFPVSNIDPPEAD